MSHDASTPRLVYRGATDERAETATASDPDDLEKKLKAGWRLLRNPKHDAHEAPPPDASHVAPVGKKDAKK